MIAAAAAATVDESALRGEGKRDDDDNDDDNDTLPNHSPSHRPAAVPSALSAFPLNWNSH